MARRGARLDFWNTDRAGFWATRRAALTYPYLDVTLDQREKKPGTAPGDLHRSEKCNDIFCGGNI